MELITTNYITAFLIGIFSTVHCIAMCGSVIGALTFSLPKEVRESQRQMFPFVLSYNIGRIISYTLAGVIVGLLSSPLDKINGHLILSLLSAIVMIAMGLYLAGWFPKFAMTERLGVPIWKRLQPLGQKLLPVSSIKNALFLGMVWGWLPCGLVYAALAVAVTSGSALHGGLVMLSFGLGTLPAVMGAGLFAGMLMRLAHNQSIRKLAGLLIILMGIATVVFPMTMDMSHHMDMPTEEMQ